VSRRSEKGYPTSAFDYELPRERIAHYPAAQRDESRLMVLDRARGTIEHRRFRDILEYIPAGDALVLNETRVFPARLIGTRASGGEAEILLLRPVPRSADRQVSRWLALVKPGARLKPGRRVHIADELEVEIVESTPDGARIVELHTSLPTNEALQKYGHMPLPPYIERSDEALDRERYQTVYSIAEGSVAAPTAGLHFTQELLAAIEQKGITLVRIVLHVGLGTFRPVDVEDPAEHVMHDEVYTVSEGAIEAIEAMAAKGGKIWAVGTTVTRTLESIVSDDGKLHAGSGSTRLFIRPPYHFKAVDHLLTNFHLPRSTLLMLVAAFGGYDLVMRAYQEAIASDYRFYSYGDAMVLI
jgi:S-adenosylmethionine:tRNA ribosyltransferase-isomerase